MISIRRTGDGFHPGLFNCGGSYDLKKILKTIDRYIIPTLRNVQYGYDLPMYICGVTHSHVDNVYHLKETYNCTANEMIDILEKLTPQQRTRYGTGYSKTDFSIVDKIYMNHIRWESDKPWIKPKLSAYIKYNKVCKKDN